MRLHTFPLSGHAHRVHLFLSLLGKEVELVHVDLANGAHKSAEFLALNPLGQVPVLEVDGNTLCDSNAILVYLARRFDASGQWLPNTPLGEAQVQRWLSIAAGELASGVGAARRARIFGAKVDLEPLHATAARLLKYMNSVLSETQYLVADHPTIADVALYTYTAHAPEGGISLDSYPAVLAWTARIQTLPGFIPMISWG